MVITDYNVIHVMSTDPIPDTGRIISTFIFTCRKWGQQAAVLGYKPGEPMFAQVVEASGTVRLSR